MQVDIYEARAHGKPACVDLALALVGEIPADGDHASVRDRHVSLDALVAQPIEDRAAANDDVRGPARPEEERGRSGDRYDDKRPARDGVRAHETKKMRRRARPIQTETR